MSKTKPATITVRLTAEQHEKLHQCSSGLGFGPYKLSLTDIIARGIELAAQELEALAKSLKDPSP